MPELIVPIRGRGALIKVAVRAGRAVFAKPIVGFLDTGASVTMLDEDIVRAMRLEPSRSASLSVLGRPEVSHHLMYDVELAIVAPDAPLHWHALLILGGPVYQTGAVAALGRDLLDRIHFEWDGPGGRATLRW